MVTTETVLDVIPVLSLAVAMAYYGMQIRNQNKTRQAQLFMQLFQRFTSKEHWQDTWDLIQMEWEDFDDYASKYDSSVNLENMTKRFSNWFFYDGMGMLLKKGLVDKEMLYYLMGGVGAPWNWEKFKDIIRESRVRFNAPAFLVWFEYLANELNKETLRKGHSLDIPEGWGRLTER